MKYQVLFSGKNKEAILKCCLLKLSPSVLSVKCFLFSSGFPLFTLIGIYDLILKKISFELLILGHALITSLNNMIIKRIIGIWLEKDIVWNQI